MLIRYLGHAMWLFEVAGLRILCDPLLDDAHYGDVFEVHPPRKLDAAALRPDFIIVSHAHFDHFNIPSLEQLAGLDADSVVLTSDALVADSCRELGFTTVRVLDAGAHVRLDGAELLTTPSFGADVEWGVAISSDGAVAWNQVDSVLRSPADVKQTLDTMRSTFQCPGDWRLELGLVRWQPLLEVQAALGMGMGFPYREYADVLEQIAALDAHAIIPGAAGAAHSDRYASMNRLVYPVSAQRLARDVARRTSDTRTVLPTVGLSVDVSRAAVSQVEAPSWISVAHQADPRAFRPTALCEVVDPNPRDVALSELRSRVRTFVHGDLRDGLAHALGQRSDSRLALDVVYATERDRYTFCVGAGACDVTGGFDPEYDVYNEVAGSLLVDVLDGRRSFGEPLLAGLLRSAVRAYDVDTTGLTPRSMAPIFLYYGLSYDESVRRNVRWLLDHRRSG